MQQMLDWAHARGMKLILCDPRCAARIPPDSGSIPPDYEEGVRAAVAEFGDHPATFGFYVGDEPDRQAKEAFFTCYRVQKATAPHLHPYDDIRRVQRNFHRHYGDLFTRLVSTRVTFYPEPFGEGELFHPNGVVSRIMPDVEGHPILIGEFADAKGQRYAMIVNNSMTESVNVGVTFPGEDVRVFSWNWSGEEYPGGAYCSDGQQRDENGLTIHHWLAPGQEAVYRVQSASAAVEPILAG